MNIKHIWSVLCRESLINKDDNVISLYGVLEQLTVSINSKKDGKSPAKINIPINYEVVSFWIKEKGLETEVKADVEIKLLDPLNQEIIKTIQKLVIPENVNRFRSRMKISGIPITKEGNYTFQVSKKEKDEQDFKLVSELPLEVKLVANKIPQNTVN